jgi:hypothetical protein
VSVDYTFRCDGPGCPRHVATPSPTPPVFLVVSVRDGNDLHFCGWDCVIRYGATMEPEEVIDA